MLKENIRIKGIPVSGGLAMGEVQVVHDPSFQVVRRKIAPGGIKAEIERLEAATKKTVRELQASRNKAIRAIGERGANVFDAQILIASDEQFFKTVVDHITSEKVNAEYAFQETLAVTINQLKQSGDPYLRQMIHDIKSVSERVLSFMLGVGDGGRNGFDKPTVLIGRIFSPGQVIAYAKRNVVGFLTEQGGPTSHMGLIVRSLGIPAIMGDFSFGEELINRTPIIIDGNHGEVIINPDQDTWRNYRRIRSRKHAQPFEVLRRARSIEPVCRDGKEVKLAANLEIPGSLEEHLVRLGIGVGLYRTEFLYFNKQAFPDEEEQYQVYSRIARRFAPLAVTLRTFDLGGDKYMENFDRYIEDNPALGWRGVRVSLEQEQLYYDQLRAMLRASAEGNIKILVPMISDVSEIAGTLEVIDKIKRELRRKAVPFDEDIKIGAMIEVPSAALQADYLAEKVDFFSIGTNDLIQYTMAADRGNHRVARYYLGHHPAVLKLIHMTVAAAHDNDIPVTVCGEMAGAKNFAPLLVGMGIDELSMNPTLLPAVADWINRFDYSDARRFASRVMRLTTADKVARALREAYDYVRQQKKGSWLK